MNERAKLLVLEAEERKEDQRYALRAVRRRAHNAVASTGGRVRHDSGGRLIVIEMMGDVAEDDLLSKLPGARLLPVDTHLPEAIEDLDENDALFLEALKVRASQGYRAAKETRTVGETPEEKELLSAPDVREEY